MGEVSESSPPQSDSAAESAALLPVLSGAVLGLPGVFLVGSSGGGLTPPGVAPRTRDGSCAGFREGGPAEGPPFPPAGRPAPSGGGFTLISTGDGTGDVGDDGDARPDSRISARDGSDLAGTA